MVGENHTFNLHPRRDGQFEGIALRMAGNRTYNRQACLLVVAPRGKDHGGPATRLLPAGLRSEIKPDQIARIRHVFTSYQSSLPSGSPQSVSECRFASVIPCRRCLRLGFPFFLRILTVPELSTANSK